MNVTTSVQLLAPTTDTFTNIRKGTFPVTIANIVLHSKVSLLLTGIRIELTDRLNACRQTAKKHLNVTRNCKST